MQAIFSRRTVFALAASLALVACSKSEAPAASASAAAAPAGKVLVAASNANFAPFESMTPDGKVQGFDADLMQAVAEKGGFEVRLVNTPWEGLFNGLAQGDSDLVISAVTITDARKQTMDFSEPYFEAKQLIAVRADSPVASLQDLKDQAVGVQTGTTGDEVVSNLQGKTSANIKRFDTTPLAMKELESGGVAAVVGDNGVVGHYLKNNSSTNLRLVADDTATPEQYGIVVRKGDTELLNKVNTGLQAIRADGTYDKIYTQWFGDAPVAAAVAGTSAAAASAAAVAASAAASN
ncbi:basic amino acid ABC transporter substrate-binding protein [Brachymonas sp. G13]|uniref:basic amino acid ABC transporter substrate-binding protein n=1 Tax=Brachymonas wangyanguii TaxID=3130163 RepID=UPI0016B5908C|nr:basic amino acid ABC transporter substrate-binding protein [Ramlibacter sp.]